MSCVNVGEGIVRVWRDWLKARCAGKGDGLMWNDSKEHVGLRANVIERIEAVNPTPVRRDEDEAVSYTLQYEGTSPVSLSHTSLTEGRSSGAHNANTSQVGEVNGTGAQNLR